MCSFGFVVGVSLEQVSYDAVDIVNVKSSEI